MTRLLAIVRRLFLAGTISLVLLLLLCGVKFSEMMSWASVHENAKGYFSIFFLASPILFLIFTIISVAYIRHHGQFAAIHQTQSPVVSFFRCLWSDIKSPFKNISGFLGALFNKNAMGRKILIIRFLELVLIVLLCLCGMGTLL